MSYATRLGRHKRLLFNSNIYFSRIHSGLYISHTENLFQGSPTVSGRVPDRDVRGYTLL
jgi:hypothetical protein